MLYCLSSARVQFLSNDAESDGGCSAGQRRTANTMLHLLAVHGVRQTDQCYGIRSQRNGDGSRSK
ncbi:hypothetical protein L917_19868 [Phytophthora nicotianae]|uniref:Uncharacterized protein n=1 Tax=Phytophthora nicotianae TaxID=4792 RepID=W2K518_PHYNI|nr:hypothetical protein L917_19868 [Phytophthora nicotianae]